MAFLGAALSLQQTEINHMWCGSTPDSWPAASCARGSDVLEQNEAKTFELAVGSR
jgi:hypothetical protein